MAFGLCWKASRLCFGASQPNGVKWFEFSQNTQNTHCTRLRCRWNGTCRSTDRAVKNRLVCQKRLRLPGNVDGGCNRKRDKRCVTSGGDVRYVTRPASKERRHAGGRSWTVVGLGRRIALNSHRFRVIDRGWLSLARIPVQERLENAAC